MFRLATDAEKAARDLVTFEAWGSPLSPAQYLEREAALRAHRWSREVMETWLWLADDGVTVLASCETFRMPATLGSRLGNTWAIASVFTEAKYRGKGYATHLMNALASHLASQPDALASTLYSDVGEAIYARSGYRPFVVDDWVFQPLDEPVEAVATTPAAPQVLPAPSGVLRITPTLDQLDWHFERGRLYARLLQRQPLQQTTAQVGDARIWFQAYFRTNELLVLWLEAADETQATPLLLLARRVAAQLGLHRVRLYDTGFNFAAAGGAKLPRDEELPMVRPLGAESLSGWGPIQRALWV